MAVVLKRIRSVLSVLLVVLIVALAILLVGVRFVGITPYTVLSGSMEPEYHVGSLIYVKAVDPKELQVNDPVTFYLTDTTVATHRIIEVIPAQADGEERCFRTKGDANREADGNLLTERNVIGKPLFSIPYLGYLSSYLQKPPGRYVALAGCTVLLLLAIGSELLFHIPQLKKAAKAQAKAQASNGEAPPSQDNQSQG